MKIIALQLAALLSAALSVAPATADVLFDNVNATSGSVSWSESYLPYYSDRRNANRIPVGTTPMRIETVAMYIERFDGFEVQVCETTADSTTPYSGECSDFTPDATGYGLRTFTGVRTVGWGNAAWVVMRSRGTTFSSVRTQSISDFSGLGQTTTDGTNWYASKSTTFGMRVEGTSLPVTGSCGSADGTTAFQFAPTGTAACNPGSLSGMNTQVDRFTWQCLGRAGGTDSPQCSAPRGYNAYTQASGGGSIEPGYLVTAGQTATFRLTIPTGYSASASGCGGSLAGDTYTTGAIYNTCLVSASFAPITYPISTPPTLGGSVGCTPNPVNHGQDAVCTATPDTGYQLTAWTGDCTGNGACHLTNVTGTRSVSAIFTPLSYAISTPATTGGSVACTPNPVAHGQAASCTATPATGYQFVGWTGDCTGSGACVLPSASGPQSVSATFAAITYAIATPAATGGSVACTPNPVPHGQTATCTATPAAGYQFTAWSGDCTGNGACQMANVTSARSVSATFALKTYAITVQPATGGSVTCTPNPVTHGQDASCTATPATGYQFTAWTGDCSGNGACQWAQVSAARSVGAQFTLSPINGNCGTAALQPRATVPTTHLCTAGTASAVQSANGQYTWECAGEHSGAAQQCSAPWANAGQGTGAVQADNTGGWQITSANFSTLPAPLPVGAQTAHVPLALVLDGGAPGASAQVTVNFTTPVPAGAVYLKYGPSPEGLGCTGAAACARPHWYVLPGAQFSADGLSVTLTLTDGGVGDSDTMPGRITDPGLPVLLAVPPGGAQAIPTLGPWALALLALLAAAVAGRRLTPWQ
ncbi:MULTISPECIES: IPTL-CTERM sorting domain-containing protein [unclassified Acidovorax]|uniref:IPTL-CTERM sorting domain-containing protein n=1 Tax=unclassified Acidovorax TaxID=2684926 RepID=UPI001C46B6BC|nr:MULTISPECIES: IPTL-CTERM sorting domain-containing protein [unclassified Acidovorax]MBV7461235.1 IPTL-CTERM sorting domain-containing protein [Acidovorax sp. sif0632]MBV7466261.1 IPTL-CTERM sorting domain-containing protein [Acidovorax sp. sif0613]